MESLGKEAADGRREASLEVRLKSRDDAALDTLERAKHLTAFHVAQTIPNQLYMLLKKMNKKNFLPNLSL